MYALTRPLRAVQIRTLNYVAAAANSPHRRAAEPHFCPWRPSRDISWPSAKMAGAHFAITGVRTLLKTTSDRQRLLCYQRLPAARPKTAGSALWFRVLIAVNSDPSAALRHVGRHRSKAEARWVVLTGELRHRSQLDGKPGALLRRKFRLPSPWKLVSPSNSLSPQISASLHYSSDTLWVGVQSIRFHF